MYIVLIVLLALACAGIGSWFIIEMEKDNQVKATSLKGLTTVCCILIAAIALFHTDNRFFASMVIIGLFFGCLGDVLLALRFVYPTRFNTMFLSGAGSFLLGHVFYVIALYSIAPKAWIVGVPLTVIALGVELFNSKKHELDMGKLFLPLGGYAAFVCFMGCSAVGACVFNFNLGTFLFAIAGVCFIVSDSILSVQCFGKTPDNVKNRTLHVFYWVAQLLIALSPMLLCVNA